ncbi:MAG: hypothetical protein WDO71_14190 [Bacteroidota bacterium]
MSYVSQLFQPRIRQKIRLNALMDFLKLIPRGVLAILHKIRCIGVTAEMSSQEKSKLGIFNHLNFFQFITGIIVPVAGLFNAQKFPVSGWLVVCMPALVSVGVLVLNAYRKHHWLYLLISFCTRFLFVSVI